MYSDSLAYECFCDARVINTCSHIVCNAIGCGEVPTWLCLVELNRQTPVCVANKTECLHTSRTEETFFGVLDFIIYCGGRSVFIVCLHVALTGRRCNMLISLCRNAWSQTHLFSSHTFLLFFYLIFQLFYLFYLHQKLLQWSRGCNIKHNHISHIHHQRASEHNTHGYWCMQQFNVTHPAAVIRRKKFNKYLIMLYLDNIVYRDSSLKTLFLSYSENNSRYFEEC